MIFMLTLRLDTPNIAHQKRSAKNLLKPALNFVMDSQAGPEFSHGYRERMQKKLLDFEQTLMRFPLKKPLEFRGHLLTRDICTLVAMTATPQFF